jgi:DNA-binding HxlR family transcriptional regulator
MPRHGDMACSIARTLDVVGDGWTPLIVRDLYLGISRFDVLARNLGVSRKVLTERLNELLEHGVIERVPYQERPPRYDYHLTQKGRELVGVLLAMRQWGDRWAPLEGGPTLLLRHDTCGAVTEPVPHCAVCGELMVPDEVTPLPGPGMQAGPGTREIPAALARLAADG